MKQLVSILTTVISLLLMSASAHAETKEHVTLARNIAEEIRVLYNAANDKPRQTLAEEVYAAHVSAPEAERKQLSLFETRILTGECRRVPGTSGAMTTTGRSVIRFSNGVQLPLVVYLEGDRGIWDGNQIFQPIPHAPGLLTADALNTDGSYNWAMHLVGAKTCGNMVNRLNSLGLPVVQIARSGTHGTAGHYGRDYYQRSEVERVKAVLNELSVLGVKQFIVVAYSGGAAVAVPAIAGRADVSLFVPVAGVLSARHFSMPPGSADPLDYASKMPTTIIIHSADDQTVSIVGARAFVKAMKQTGLNGTLEVVEGNHNATMSFAIIRLRSGSI